VNRLSDEEKLFFEKLMKIREEGANYLEMPFLRGVKGSVVDKYSDQAHFIYELLQNADDAKATQAKFILKDHGLLFIHNGSIHFSISDPEKEDEDKEANRLGHINSITSIANSAKNEASIGKFGVGFKAVFQYTDTPYIYDPRFEFKIERFIVPKSIEDDIRIDIIRNETDTIFYFPFDKLDLTREKAYSEIYEKLGSLIFPTLFLSNLNEVSWKTDITNGKYYKKRKTTEFRDDIKIELFDIFREYFGALHEERLWLFSRQLDKENHTYSIGFFFDKGNKLKPVNHPAFCFFPTKEKTGLKFIVHAPFLLTDSREGIKAGEKWNQDLIMRLADLGAEILLILRDKNFIDDGIVEIIPYKETEFKREENFDSISFRPFYDSIKNILQNEELLPAKYGKYTKRTHAYWADSTELCELFSNSQLAKLVSDPDAKWVFTSIGRTKDTDLTQYIDGGDDRINRKPHLITANYTPEKILNVITADFIQCQTFQWLNQLYGYLLERKSYRDYVKYKPIFIDANRNAVSAFDKNNDVLKLFLPKEGGSEYTTIHDDFIKNDTSMKFFETFGIKEPSLEGEIYNKILPSYDSGKEIGISQHSQHFRKLFAYYKSCPNPKIPSYVNSMENKKIIFF